ncbi:hypothetical protein Tco_1513414, partial [Tanacetum coccineum]
NGIGVNAGDSKLMLLGINLLLMGKVNAARHKLTAAGEIAFLTKRAESEGFEQIVDFLNAQTIKYALTVNPTIYTSCIEQFWATVKVKTVNGEVQLQALVNGKKITVTEESIRSDLQLNNEEDAKITLVDETQGRYGDDLMFDTYVLDDEEVFVAEQGVFDKDVNLSVDEVTLAQALTALKSAKV